MVRPIMLKCLAVGYRTENEWNRNENVKVDNWSNLGGNKKKKIRGGLGVASMGKMRDNWLTCYDDWWCRGT